MTQTEVATYLQTTLTAYLTKQFKLPQQEILDITREALQRASEAGGSNQKQLYEAKLRSIEIICGVKLPHKPST
jgi:adenylate kinase family enzyme